MVEETDAWNEMTTEEQAIALASFRPDVMQKIWAPDNIGKEFNCE